MACRAGEGRARDATGSFLRFVFARQSNAVGDPALCDARSAGEDADRRGEASGPLATLPGARTVTAAESSGTEERSAVEKFFFPDKEELPGDFQMPIWDHLEELRERVIVAALACGAAILTCFCFSKDLVVFLEAPVMEKGVRFLQLSPGEFFFTTIKARIARRAAADLLASLNAPTDPASGSPGPQVAGYAGLLLSVPTVLYEIIAYVVPGLTRDERKFLGPVVLGSTFLFILGLFFSYQVTSSRTLGSTGRPSPCAVARADPHHPPPPRWRRSSPPLRSTSSSPLLMGPWSPSGPSTSTSTSSSCSCSPPVTRAHAAARRVSALRGSVGGRWRLALCAHRHTLLALAGLSFQVPVIQLMLGQLRIVTADQMFSQWRFVVVGATIAAAGAWR